MLTKKKTIKKPVNRQLVKIRDLEQKLQDTEKTIEYLKEIYADSKKSLVLLEDQLRGARVNLREHEHRDGNEIIFLRDLVTKMVVPTSTLALENKKQDRGIDADCCPQQERPKESTFNYQSKMLDKF